MKYPTVVWAIKSVWTTTMCTY